MPDQFRVVNVPTVGQVQFPSSMSDDDVSAAIKKNYPHLSGPTSHPTSDILDKLAPAQGEMPLLSPGQDMWLPGAENSKSLSNATPWQGKPQKPAPIAPWDVQARIQTSPKAVAVKQKAAKGIQTAVDVANTPIVSAAMKQAGGFDPAEMYAKNRAAEKEMQQGSLLPETSPWISRAEGLSAGAWDALSGLTSPANLAMAAGFGVAPEGALAKAGQALFTGQALGGAAEETKNALEATDTEERWRHLTGAGVNALFGGLGALHVGSELLHGTEVPSGTKPAIAQQTVGDTRLPSSSNTPEGEPSPSQVANAPETNRSNPVGTVAPAVESPAVPASVVASTEAKPEGAPPHQALNPSSPIAEQEGTLKGLVGKYLRMRQLYGAAEQRIGLDRALNAVGTKGFTSSVDSTTGETERLPIRNSRPVVEDRPFEELSDADKQTVKSVLSALNYQSDKKITLAEFQARHYRLLDDNPEKPGKSSELEKLEAVHKAGLKTQPASDYFGVQAIHPFSRVTRATAEAAGVPDYGRLRLQAPELSQSAQNQSDLLYGRASEVIGRVLGVSSERAQDLFSDPKQLSPQQMKLLLAAKKAGQITQDDLTTLKAGSTPTAEEAMAGGVQVAGGKSIKGTGVGTTVGADLGELEARHSAMQKVLERRMREAKGAITEAIPAWRQARLGETAPSELAQEVNKLSARTKQTLPNELYAEEHLTAKAAPGSAGSEPTQPVQGPQGPATPESTQAAAQPAQEVPGAKPVVSGIEQKINDLSQKIATEHGQEANNALSKLFSAVDEKYKSPEKKAGMFYRLAQKYAANLKAGTQNPLDSVLETLKSYPEDNGQQTVLYSNPLMPLIQRFFKAGTAALGRVGMQAWSQVIQPHPITKLADEVERTQGQAPLKAQADAWLNNETNRFVDGWNSLPGTLADRRRSLSNTFQAIKNTWMNRPGLSPWDHLMGKRDLSMLETSLAASDFVDKFKAAHPDAIRRAAIVAWVEAHKAWGSGMLGDKPGDITSRLNDTEALTNVTNQMHDLAGSRFINRENNQYYKVFKAATDLTPAEKQFAQQYAQYDADMVARESALGLHHEAQMDYFEHIWNRNNFAQDSLAGLRSGMGFGTTANFEKMRSFVSYFEGLQKGWKPNSMDSAYLITSRAMSSARVIANRQLVEALQKMPMPDGTKAAGLSGVGVVLDDPQDPDKIGAILIKQGLPAKAHTVDGDPFLRINHPAFRDWKWLGATENGAPILGKTDIVVHPEIYAQVKRALEPSKIRESAIGNTLLKMQSVAKQTLLSLSLFHPSQLTAHLMEHAGVGAITGTTSSRVFRALNPLTTEKFVDLSDRDLQMGILHGLKLRMFDAEDLWDDGLMKRGGASGAPFLGGIWGPMHDMVFKNFLPNVKAAMFHDILERNMNRYHEQYKMEELKNAGLTTQNASTGMHSQASIAAQSRIYRMSAMQTNSAFGGIDWSKLPIGKTGQDVLRLMFLAPDFLAARAGFVVDALRPGGAESRQALGLGFAAQYLVCRGMNAWLNNGDSKNDLTDWNKVVIGHHAYSLRTVQGDMIDAILDPRRFAEHRVNPMWRPLGEAFSQKDIYGHPIQGGQFTVDTLKGLLPIPIQGAVDDIAPRVWASIRSSKQGESTLDSVMNGLFGIQRSQYRTPAERYVFSEFDKQPKAQPETDLEFEQKNTFKYLRDQYQQGKLNDDDLINALNGEGKRVAGVGGLVLKPSEAKYMFRTRTDTQLASEARQLGPEEVYTAWQKSSEMEKLQLTPILLRKMGSLPPALQEKVQAQVEPFMDSLSSEKQEKLFQDAQAEKEWEDEKNGVKPEQQGQE